MKKIFLFILTAFIFNGCLFVEDKTDIFGDTINQNTNTTVFIVNTSNDTVQVYLTIGSDTNYVTNVNGIFGITDTGLQGIFYMNPFDTFSYTSPMGKGFDGNISFNTPPNNCPDTVQFPMGINLFEFALNNNFPSVVNPQETIDISCVSGANSYISCNLHGGGIWNASPSYSNVTTFKNSSLYDNTGLVGVFPFGCDNCNSIGNPPICPNQKKFAKPQSEKICNVQRNASNNGGQVVIIFEGFIKGEILK